MADQFDFIVNNNSTNSRPSINSGSQNQKIIVVAVGAFVLLLIAFIFYLLVFTGGKTTAQIMLPVAGAQADIAAISATGLKQARGAELRNDSATTNLVITTHRNTTNKYIGEKADKQVEAYQNTSYVKELEEAEQSGSFDSEYEKTLSQQIDLYKQLLVTAYNEAETVALKKELEVLHSEAKILAGDPVSPPEE